MDSNSCLNSFNLDILQIIKDFAKKNSIHVNIETKNKSISKIELIGELTTESNLDPQELHLPEELSQITSLTILNISNMPLSDLSNIPISLKKIFISATHINSFIGCPDSLPYLKAIYLKDNKYFQSLDGLPKSLPRLKYLEIENCPLQSIEGISRYHTLRELSLLKTHLPNFKEIFKIRQKNPKIQTSIDSCMFISLYGLPKDKEIVNFYLDEIYHPKTRFYSKEERKLTHNGPHKESLVPKSYYPFISRDRLSWEKIHANFNISPHTLANQLCKGHNLSEFEEDRIIYEGTLETIRVLEQGGLHQDPILLKLKKRWNITFDIPNLIL